MYVRAVKANKCVKFCVGSSAHIHPFTNLVSICTSMYNVVSEYGSVKWGVV